MNETYTLAFDIDPEHDDVMLCAVLYRNRNGDVALGNVIQGDTVIDLWELITGREFEY